MTHTDNVLPARLSADYTSGGSRRLSTFVFSNDRCDRAASNPTGIRVAACGARRLVLFV